MFDLFEKVLMGAKYAYCGFGHPRPVYMEACPTCAPVTESVTKRPKNVTPVTKREQTFSQAVDVSDVKAAANEGGLVMLKQRGRPRKHQTNAERQAAYRGRRG